MYHSYGLGGVLANCKKRGGDGNVHKEKYGGHSHDPSKPTLIEKAKALLTGKKEKKTEESSATTTTS